MKQSTFSAEKKAKQFLNLLQGYTKGIRITAILILLLMGVGNAWATNGTISGGGIIYLNSGGSGLWDQESAWFSVYFMDANKSATKFVSMTKVTGNYYYATVPTGTWKYVIFVRNNPTDKTADWTNVWNQTSDLETQSDKNLYTITGWNGKDGSWGTYQPTATGSLVASSSNNVAKNTNITLTPSISPTTYNVLKSTSYSISPSSGATISNNIFKATAGGSYTVTATITYNAKGFTSITQTATAKTTITVKPTITFNANGGSGSMSAQTVSYNTNTTLSANTFTAPVDYTFNGWNTKTDGTGTAYAAGTSYKFTSDLTLYAQWQENTIKVTIATNGHGTTSPDREANVGVISGCEIKATPNPGCEFVKWTATEGITITNENSAETTIKATKEGTLTAIFKEKPANTVYLKAATWWKDNDARTAIWAWKENSNPAVEGWVDVDYDDCTGNILQAEIPAKYDRIKFVRLKPSSANGYNGENNGYHWDNEWNSTETLTVPTDNKNLYDITTNANAHLFFKSNSNWTTDGARTAAYFFGNGEKWVSMTDIGDGIYYCEKPSGYTKVIFVRMNGSNQTNDWNNKWNQTGNLTLPTDGKNLYTINGGLDNLSGTWSTEADNVFDSHRWTTYTAPTFDVTISAATNGTIKVAYNGQTYTSGQTISNVPIHTELNVTFTPATGYVLTNPQVTYADQIAEGVYSICGPSVISAAFTPRGETRVIYLRPNDDWLHDDAIFVAHAWNGDGNSNYVLTTKDNDYTGSYSCTIDSKYDHILFARLDPADKGNINLENAWNKTIDLEIVESIYTTNNQTRFAIGDKNGDLYDGAWEKNTPIWGLTADFSSWRAEEAIFRGYPGKVDILLHSGTHEFVLYNIKTGSYFHNNGTYTRNHSGQWWTMNGQNNCKLVADVDNALYHFQMRYRTQVGEFKKQISITYPNTDVYYLAYQEGEDSKSFRKSHAIDKITEGEKQDTISFFVNVDNTPYLYLLDYAGNVLAKHFITGTGGADPNNAMLPSKRNSDATLYVGAGCGVENTGVYNFILLQEGNEAQIDAAATHLYTGSFYIRTDAAEGGWDSFRQKSNQITYSSFADKHSNFNHYYCKYIDAGRNVKFTIANDYSYCISGTLDNDLIIEEGQSSPGCLPINANVRFGWNSNTNEISRAYIKGAGMTSDRFLVLQGQDNNLKDANGAVIPVGTGDRTGLFANEEILVDQQNWIYQVDVTANKDTEVKLIAEYNGQIQYFKGKAEEYTRLLSSTASKDYKIRLIYDFKSNHLVTAWLAGGNTVKDEQVLGADMMVIRTDQGQADQLNFDPTKSQMKDVAVGYAVMTFTKDHITDNTKMERERSLYWVSFPFDVKVSDVFGFGEYAEHWILQYYDGAERAEKGLFSDSGTYWKYIFDTDTKLKAGEGYVLVLDLNKIEFLHGATEVSLYFPSINELNTISGELPTAATVPEHLCNIDREWTENGTTYHHKWTDSHWNLIGVPGFADIQEFDVTAYHFTQYKPDVSFYYAFDLKNSTYTVASAATNFQAMYSYMVQFAGTINWVSKTVKGVDPQPTKLAARRNSNSDEPERVALRLELAQGEEVADRTFVQLQQEGATANFDLSLDLTKIMNSGFSNIYTLTDSLKIQVAGNALPMEETVVPVGVNIATAGEYTFRMPDGTEGMVVELIDYETNTTTNLLLDDYTVNLPTGCNETRFALSIKPEKTATNVGNIGGTMNDGQGVRKFIIDGKLYLQKDGMLYDAQGHIVR